MILSRVIALAVLASSPACAMLGRLFNTPGDGFVQLPGDGLDEPLHGGQRQNTFLSPRRALCLAAGGGLAACGVYTVCSRAGGDHGVVTHSPAGGDNPLLTSAVVPGTYESFYSGLKKDLAARTIDASALATTFLDAHEWALNQKKNDEAFEIIHRVEKDVIAPAKAQVAGWRCNADSCEAEQTNNSWLIRDSARWGGMNKETRVVVEKQLAELEAMFVSIKVDLNETIKALAAEGSHGPAALRGGALANATANATASHYDFLKRFILHASRMLGVGLDSQSQEFNLQSGGAALCTSNVLPLTTKQYEQEAVFAYWRHMYAKGGKSAEALKAKKMFADVIKAMITGNESGLTPEVENYIMSWVRGREDPSILRNSNTRVYNY